MHCHAKQIKNRPMAAQSALTSNRHLVATAMPEAPQNKNVIKIGMWGLGRKGGPENWVETPGLDKGGTWVPHAPEHHTPHTDTRTSTGTGTNTDTQNQTKAENGTHHTRTKTEARRERPSATRKNAAKPLGKHKKHTHTHTHYCRLRILGDKKGKHCASA